MFKIGDVSAWHYKRKYDTHINTSYEKVLKKKKSLLTSEMLGLNRVVNWIIGLIDL